MDNSVKPTHHPVVSFGEVLWDILPGGRYPGGAPVNVSYHLTRLGRNPALLSRVGKDPAGGEIAEAFASRGVCIDYFQRDPLYPTGYVLGQPDVRGDMVYDIASPVAWDHIAYEPVHEVLLTGARYFIFGTLAARSEVSRRTLLTLLDKAPIKVFDINLRAPHYEKGLIDLLLRRCDILKLNLDELLLLSGWYGITGDPVALVRALADRFGLRTIVVTMGGEGAMLYASGDVFRHPGYRVRVADTVGAGDAFLAGFLAGVDDQLSYEDILRSASLMGAFVAASKGACPEYDLPKLAEFGKQFI